MHVMANNYCTWMKYALMEGDPSCPTVLSRQVSNPVLWLIPQVDRIVLESRGESPLEWMPLEVSMFGYVGLCFASYGSHRISLTADHLSKGLAG